MTESADSRTIAQGTNRWITDSRVYNLVWLGRWIERAQTIARVVRWASQQDQADGQQDLETVLGMAAKIRGVAIGPEDTALEMLLTRDSGASLRGCLVAARFNATHVAPVEVMQVIGAAIELMDSADEPITTSEEVVELMDEVLPTLEQLHSTIEEAWFHYGPLSEEEVYRRFVQQQQ
jgi:hypothetical protein